MNIRHLFIDTQTRIRCFREHLAQLNIIYQAQYILCFCCNIFLKMPKETQQSHNSYRITLTAKGLPVQPREPVTSSLVVTLVRQTSKGQVR